VKKVIAILGTALVTACGNGGSSRPAPVIASFQAAPGSIRAGEAVTLSWAATGADTLAIDNGIGPVTGSSVIVTPPATTTYRLTATNATGSVSSTALVTVLPAKPAILSFGGTPSSVAIGSSTTLSWTTTGQVDSVRIDPGAIDVTAEHANGAGHHVIASVAVDTTYTLTVTNPGGSATQTALVTTHDPALRFTYTDPVSTTAKLRLVQNVELSTLSHLVLDLKVAAPIDAFGLAMTIPLTAASAGMIGTPTWSVPAAGPIQPGASPATAAIKLVPGAAGLPDSLTFGLAKHKGSAADTTDVALPVGATLLSIAVDFGPTTPVPGTLVFDGGSLLSDGRYRAAALHFDGAQPDPAGKGDIAVGTLQFTN